MENKTIVIMGSSNPMGDTYDICSAIVKKTGFKFQDLMELVIMPYDYEYENSDDDFIGFMRHVVKDYDHIILASPIYWYTISGTMKNFIDRFTDLLTKEKATGRALRGKSLQLISVSKSDNCPEEFAMPIERTANYLAMEWKGHTHFPIDEKEICERRLESF
jgi:NAD(P)H-dependent FMN reductase